MKYCGNCGKEISDDKNLCDDCGKNAGQQTQNTASVFKQYEGQTHGGFDPADVENNKILALLSYLGFLFLIPLLAAPNSPYARFHANQGLVLFLAEIVLGIAISIVSFIIIFIPILGAIISALLSLAGFVIPIVLAIIGIMNAYKGFAKELPVIGQFKIIK